MTDLTINVDAVVDFMVELLNKPSPTGYYIEAMDYVEAAFAALDMPDLTLTRTKRARCWPTSASRARPGTVSTVSRSSRTRF